MDQSTDPEDYGRKIPNGDSSEMMSKSSLVIFLATWILAIFLGGFLVGAVIESHYHFFQHNLERDRHQQVPDK